MERQEERVLREREIYNQGLDRGWYNALFSHSSALTAERSVELFRSVVLDPSVERVLEFGSTGWQGLVAPGLTFPPEFHCINISEAEIEKGEIQAREQGLDIRFHLMDAHALEFPDDYFDVVYGFGILHHLNYEQALKEIHRVLKPTGKMIFNEPLDMNPVAQLVRAATPRARTVDEEPIRYRHLPLFKKYFDVKFNVYELTSVPVGVMTYAVGMPKGNSVVKAAFDLDGLISRLPGVRFWFRKVIVEGTKKAL